MQYSFCLSQIYHFWLIASKGKGKWREKSMMLCPEINVDWKKNHFHSKEMDKAASRGRRFLSFSLPLPPFFRIQMFTSGNSIRIIYKSEMEFGLIHLLILQVITFKCNKIQWKWLIKCFFFLLNTKPYPFGRNLTDVNHEHFLWLIWISIFKKNLQAGWLLVQTLLPKKSIFDRFHVNVHAWWLDKFVQIERFIETRILELVE